MELKGESSVDFYRKLLTSAKIFLTEVDGRSSTSISESTSRCQSATASVCQSSISIDSKDIDQQLISTRQRCHQRLLTCSRKKLRLLSLQEQNDKRHLGFKKFVDNLDEKRSANIRRYQLELRDYLLKRLEADRLRQEVDLLNMKIDQLKEEKKCYSNLIDIVQKAIPLFPPGLLQGGSDGVKSLILRYQTLVETKSGFEQRDLSKEKQERRHQLQRLILEHNTRIAKLSTRLAQLHDKLNDLQKTESINEEKFINKTDTKRSTTTVISQLELSINYLFDRYRLVHQIKTTTTDQTISEKLRTIQDFILYRIDLVQKAKS
ncbi:unnamed protein product [Rotaria socialis]|uniref:Uncharacterized protein n=1 Tax=Rotaria socialis TaxID=392032 RepID=A0A818WBJ8_9BILA|nr:unnamed protein product [Rotaria socialis]CAF3721921.1 unnamed protein product [Rotaria socialis]CAF4200294.1 unnamed protein product [Rotaria socialis]CAF4446369.1 unnamed protein product [Rotaria socialis]